MLNDEGVQARAAELGALVRAEGGALAAAAALDARIQ
jgi:hypothetical protein